MRHNKGVGQAITRDPAIMHGVPVFRGTRVPVQTLFEYLEGGDTLEDFLEGFPTVSREIAIGVLHFRSTLRDPEPAPMQGTTGAPVE